MNGQVHDWWGLDNRKWRLLLSDVAAHDPDFRAHVPFLEGLTDHRHMAAVEWILTMREGLKQMALKDGSVELVRYEELAASPGPSLDRIFGATGLPDDPKCRAYATEALSPAPPKARFDLPEVIAGPFLQTMAELGYSAQAT